MVRMTDHDLGIAAAAPVCDLACRKSVMRHEGDELGAVIGVDVDIQIDSWIEKIVAHVTVGRAVLDGFAQDQRSARRALPCTLCWKTDNCSQRECRWCC